MRGGRQTAVIDALVPGLYVWFAVHLSWVDCETSAAQPLLVSIIFSSQCPLCEGFSFVLPCCAQIHAPMGNVQMKRACIGIQCMCDHYQGFVVAQDAS